MATKAWSGRLFLQGPSTAVDPPGGWEARFRAEVARLNLEPGSTLHFALWLLFQTKRPAVKFQYLHWLSKENPLP